MTKTSDRFDKLLKAMVEGEAPKGRKAEAEKPKPEDKKRASPK